MKIVDFKREHITQAKTLVRQNFDELRLINPNIPKIINLPEMVEFADNNMGIAIFNDENDILLGFMSCYGPFENAFRNKNVNGIWSPIHANAVINQVGIQKDYIYKRLYEHAAKKWVEKGALIHSITLYEHEKEVINAFYTYGFGLRCVDAVRSLDNIKIMQNSIKKLKFSELQNHEYTRITNMKNLLIEHLRQSPCFLNYKTMSESECLEKIHQNKIRIFIAENDEKIIGMIQIKNGGENFISDSSEMQNICSAYLLEEYRNQGIFEQLLQFVIETVKTNGYKCLGVDFESFNPSGSGFWLKHFKAYTSSVVRRIDG